MQTAGAKTPRMAIPLTGSASKQQFVYIMLHRNIRLYTVKPRIAFCTM